MRNCASGNLEIPGSIPDLGLYPSSANMFVQVGNSRLGCASPRNDAVSQWPFGPSKQRVLHPLTLRQQRQGLAGDAVLEMSALLMRLERGFVAEQLVEQELRGIFS